MSTDVALIADCHLVEAFDEEVARCFKFNQSLDCIQSNGYPSPHFVNYGLFNSLHDQSTTPPFEWRNTNIFSSYCKAIDLTRSKIFNDSYDLDLTEDVDVSFAFDHHSLVTSQLPDSYDDIVQTADEIIKEIDLLMNDENVPLSLCCVTESGITSKPHNSESSWFCEEDLSDLSLNELNAILEEFECCVKEYSASLVQELAYREELDFEQEQKDIFIARLDEMHRRLERKRHSSVPSEKHIQLFSHHSQIKSGQHTSLKCSNCDTHQLFAQVSPTLQSNLNRQAPHFISRAHSAAQAAVAATSSATVVLKKQWRRLSGFHGEVTASDNDDSDHGPNKFEKSTLSADKEERSKRLEFAKSAHTIAIARLRKWAGRKTTSASTGETNNSSKSALRRVRNTLGRNMESFICNREARSAVTTPTSSHFEFPPIPANLTHSASGYLIGRPEFSADDLEYKYLTTSIPYHKSPYNEGPTVEQLELFNDMLLAILTNNPMLTPMLTDYILNVYAPADNRLSKLPI